MGGGEWRARSMLNGKGKEKRGEKRERRGLFIQNVAFVPLDGLLCISHLKTMAEATHCVYRGAITDTVALE